MIKLVLKKLGFIAFLCLAELTMVYAGHQQQSFNPGTTLPADSLRKDSVSPVSVINDMKAGFNNLFLKSPGTTGFSSEQLNPQAVSFVEDYVLKFGKTMEDMKTWGKPYFDMMDAILEQHGLPKELKYLAVIESHLKSNIRSWAGAVGPWQFMPATARNFGLRVSKYYDERTDYFKSTHAASRYLTDLYGIYGDWLLVIAAYNGGPANVNYAIKKSGSRDFWTLQNYLPVESKNHVKKFIATHFIMEGQGGITTFTKDEIANKVFITSPELTQAEIDSSKTTPVTGRYNVAIMLKYLDMDLAGFNHYNPGFDTKIANEGSYELRLPNAKMDIFLAKKSDILRESVEWLLNPVKEVQQAPAPKKGF